MPAYDKFTDRSRKAMALANQEARRRHHEYLGTEHILLGLVLEESNVAAEVLKDKGISLRTILQEIEKLVKDGPTMVAMGGKLPLTPRSRSVLEIARNEANALNHRYIGCEHLFLGLLNEEDGVAAQVFFQLGADRDDLRHAILAIVGTEVTKQEGHLKADLIARRVDEQVSPLKLYVDPGTAPASELAELLTELSNLYRMLGGSGITFTRTDVREVVTA